MAKRVKIPGRLESAEVGGIVTGAGEIIDDVKGKKQSVINSEVDAELVRLENEKQDNITVDSVPTEGSGNPVSSGAVYTAEKALSDAIEAILLLIPSAASALNQLADKTFVRDSISTATATPRGTFNVVSDLHLSVNATHAQIEAALDALSLGADLNDYCFVQIPDDESTENIKKTERYKFNGTSWVYEYDLNNSGFTAAQWEAINSNITSLLVTKLSQLPTNEVLTALLAAKQDNLTFDDEPTAGSNNPVTSGGIYTRNNEIVAMITALEAAKQNVLTFDSTPINGSENPVTSGGVYNAIYLVQVVLAGLDGRMLSAEHSIEVLTENVGILRTLYQALSQSDIIVGAKPTTGVANTVYRVPGTSTYADWMYYNGAWVKLAEYTTLDGYLYKGIATPNGSPAASAVKMFYFALTAGTYSNFGNLVVTEGLSILKYDGANWTQDKIQGVDDEPTAGSHNLVESGSIKAELDSTNLTISKIDIKFDVVINGNLFISEDLKIPAGTPLSIHLDSDLIDNNGVNFDLYSGDTRYRQNLYNHSTINYTTEVDVTHIEIIRAYSGIIGTGSVIISITNNSGLETRINNTLIKTQQSLSSQEKTQVWQNLGLSDSLKVIDDKSDIFSQNVVKNRGISQDILQAFSVIGMPYRCNTPADNDCKIILPVGSYNFKITPGSDKTLSTNIRIYKDASYTAVAFTNANNEGVINVDSNVDYLEYHYGSNDTVGTDGVIEITSLQNFSTQIKKVDKVVLEEPFTIETINPTMLTGYFYDINGTKTENSSSLYAQPIDIAKYAGKDVSVTINLQNPQTGGRYCLITDANDNILSKGREAEAVNNKIPLGVIPDDGKYLLVSVKTGTTVIGVDLIKTFPQFSDIVYVDADNGSDENTGRSWSDALASIGKALEVSSDDVTINYKGISAEKLTISGKKKVSIFGKAGELNRIMLGTKIGSEAVQYSGNVYKKQLSSFPSSFDVFYLYQYGVGDADTLITDAERHPLQRGKTHRLDCSRIYKAESLEALVSDTKLSFYWDSANTELYFKIAEGSNLADNPVCIPNGDACVSVSGTQVCITNIDCYFGNMIVQNTVNSTITDCAVKYARGAGGIRYDGSVGITLRRCEACCIFDGDGNGDGFNAHATTTGSSALIRRTTGVLIDCWAHDVDDDGFSDHECCESVVYGGLYEYNGKGGLTPANGSHCIAYNVVSRRNWNGFYCGGAAADGDQGSQLECFNCVASDNYSDSTRHGFGYKTGNGNILILHNCKSRNNVKGYGFYSNEVGIINMFDCTSDGDGQQLRVGSGTINIINSTIVLPHE